MQRKTGVSSRAQQIARRRVFNAQRGWEQGSSEEIREAKAVLIQLPEYKDFLNSVDPKKERNA